MIATTAIATQATTSQLSAGTASENGFSFNTRSSTWDEASDGFIDVIIVINSLFLSQFFTGSARHTFHNPTGNCNQFPLTGDEIFKIHPLKTLLKPTGRHFPFGEIKFIMGDDKKIIKRFA